MNWHPATWRSRPAQQMPTWPDAPALTTVESCLRSAAPLSEVSECEELSALLAEVALGRGFLLQGGDCAESFAEFGADKVRRSFNLLQDMAAAIGDLSGGPVVPVGRIAGQFAKPRSSALETIEGVTLPAWRGDIVNGQDFTAASRTPDPNRMLEAHRQAGVTCDLIRAYSAAAYAGPSETHRTARGRISVAFEHATATGDPHRPVRFFTSHEALLLNYEEALTRWDERTGRWWSRSAHMLWLGDRTRQLDGAHVEFVSGIANPVGLKCGPAIAPDELLKLIEKLDPENQPGRLVLICRMGAEHAEHMLPPLMRSVKAAGSHAIWAVDPMHGNTTTSGGRKTRRISDIFSEIRIFFAAAESEGVHFGGVHLELTGGEVTECVGGSVTERDLPGNYLTHCDPRLNQTQAEEVAREIGTLMTYLHARERSAA